jgi:hypothetical protein
MGSPVVAVRIAVPVPPAEVLGRAAAPVLMDACSAPVLVCRYYRSVVCALALAATASLRAQSVPGRSSQAAATLHLQAAKVSPLQPAGACAVC